MQEMRNNPVSPKCFVIMSFEGPLEDYYTEIFQPAIKEAGLIPVRGDEIVKAGVISKQVWQEIHDAEICVADLSGNNPNVMYELGIAHALEKPVIPVVQNVSELPFDIRHIRHILYDLSKVDWAATLKKTIKSMLKESRSSSDSILFGAPRKVEQVRCSGTLTELFYFSGGEMHVIEEETADRRYSPLEEVSLLLSDDVAELRFDTRTIRPDGNDSNVRLTGSGFHFRGAAYLTYNFQNKDTGRRSTGAMILQLMHSINIRGLWMTTNIDKGDFLIGRIDLERSWED